MTLVSVVLAVMFDYVLLSLKHVDMQLHDMVVVAAQERLMSIFKRQPSAGEMSTHLETQYGGWRQVADLTNKLVASDLY